MEEWHTVVKKKRNVNTHVEIVTDDFGPVDLRILGLLQKKGIGMSAFEISNFLSLDITQVGDCLYDGPLSKYVVRDPPLGQHIKGQKPKWKLII